MRYCKINTCDIGNGEGIRVSLFISGCNFHCKGCFNEEAQSFDFGEEYNLFTRRKILKAVKDSKISGLSILGGDPLCQTPNDLMELTSLCKAVQSYNKTVWIWSGYTYEQLFKSIEIDDFMYNLTNEYRRNLIRHCDVFVDGKYMEDKKDPSLAWRGSSNQRIIDIDKTLRKGKLVLFQEEV